jgi:hypothetical protein
MRRQIHLVYDMICETPYVEDLVKANSNLLLKKNLFSMKQMSKIKDGVMLKELDNKVFKLLSSHVRGCEVILMNLYITERNANLKVKDA